MPGQVQSDISGRSGWHLGGYFTLKMFLFFKSDVYPLWPQTGHPLQGGTVTVSDAQLGS